MGEQLGTSQIEPMELSTRPRSLPTPSICVLLFLAAAIAGAWMGFYFLREGPFSVGGGFWSRLINQDGNWYLSVAERGYSWSGATTEKQNIAFFPFYPVLEWIIARVVGGWKAWALVGSSVLASPAQSSYFTGLRSVSWRREP